MAIDSPTQVPEVLQPQFPFLDSAGYDVLSNMLSEPAESDEDVVRALTILTGTVCGEFNDMMNKLARIRQEIVDTLGWRVAWGQRYARELPAFHRARCEASAQALTVVSVQFDAVCRQFDAIVVALRAQTALEEAATLLANKEG